MAEYPFSARAIRVEQPLGEFFAVSLPAWLLLDVTYSDPLRVTDADSDDASLGLRGHQREAKPHRERDIGQFIDTAEAAFPNSVILGANFREDGKLENDDHYRWKVKKVAGGFELEIPSNQKLAPIVDGQHRLFGFRHSMRPERRSMELLCAVYLDLPIAYQAYLFWSINFNQKKVDRSLAYQLIGFGVEREEPGSWTPEKLAVFLSRKLNIDRESPFFHHIVVAAQNDELLLDHAGSDGWKVSTATITDGILRLISKKPKLDRETMFRQRIGEGRKRSLLTPDGTPLRSLFLEINDLAIYTAVIQFFTVADRVLWSLAKPASYIRKTVGIQALFDLLRSVLHDFEERKDLSIAFFRRCLEPSAPVDFSDNFFQASGTGKSRIAKTLQFNAGLIDLANDDVLREEIKRLNAGA